MQTMRAVPMRPQCAACVCTVRVPPVRLPTNTTHTRVLPVLQGTLEPDKAGGGEGRGRPDALIVHTPAASTTNLIKITS
jgi:hypothetical protein